MGEKFLQKLYVVYSSKLLSFKQCLLCFSILVVLECQAHGRGGDGDQEHFRAIYFDYLLTPTDASQITIADFDLAEVTAGERIVVQINILNYSKKDIEIVSRGRLDGQSKSQLVKASTSIADREKGLLFITISIPENASALSGTTQMLTSIGNGHDLLFRFAFKYRDLALFRLPASSFSLVVHGRDQVEQRLEVLLPIDLSNDSLLPQLRCESDETLQGIEFSVVSKDKTWFVRASFGSELLATKDLAGMVRLLVNKRVMSESKLVVKRKRNFELVPGFISLKYNANLRKYQGEIILQIKDGRTNMKHVDVLVEHIDEIPVTAELVEMSKNSGRIYLSVSGSEKLKNSDLVRFEIRTPLIVDEQILSVMLFR